MTDKLATPDTKLDVSGPSFTAVADTTPVAATTSRPDYVTRRWALFSDKHSDASYSEVDAGAISRLPLSMQVAFRLKMLSIFAIQVFLVWVVVGVFRFQPDAKRLAYDFFDTPAPRLVISFGVGFALLVALYFARSKFPINWLLLLAFTAAQSFCFVGLGVALDTNIGFFNCAFTFTCVVIMLVLSGVRRRSSPDDEGWLLTSFAAGAIAYVVVTIVACGLFAKFGDDVVTKEGFGLTLVFQFFLILWFSYDASSMYRIMTPDEYMQGVIYFYTDLILLTLVVLATIGTIAAMMAMCAMCEGGGGADCGGADCGGAGCYVVYCGDCRCCTTSSSYGMHQHDEDMERV